MKRLKKAADAPPTTYVKYERLANDFGERMEKLGKTLLDDSDELPAG